MWYETFDSVFWITIITILTGCIGLCIKYCLKSKCDNVKCCFGLVEIHRDIEIEAEEELRAMELGIQRNESKLNINE